MGCKVFQFTFIDILKFSFISFVDTSYLNPLKKPKYIYLVGFCKLMSISFGAYVKVEVYRSFEEMPAWT